MTDIPTTLPGLKAFHPKLFEEVKPLGLRKVTALVRSVTAISATPAAPMEDVANTRRMSIPLVTRRVFAPELTGTEFLTRPAEMTR